MKYSDSLILAQNDDTPVEVLSTLATDADAYVRSIAQDQLQF